MIDWILNRKFQRGLPVLNMLLEILLLMQAYEKKNGKNVIYLNIGDPVQYDFPAPDHIKNALIKAVQSNENFYTHPKDYQSFDKPL